MKSFSRRELIGGAIAGAASRLIANPLGAPLGCQTWPVRNEIGKDLDGTLKRLATDGFRAIELCSPAGYAQLGFGPLGKMKGSELRDRIQSAGLFCESCHFNMGELRENLDDRIAWAKDLGLQQMIIATFWLPKGATMADWLKACDEANRIGERTASAGIQLGFHNHDFEFQKIDGQLIYDKLMSQFDPKLVRMQFQVGVIELGYKAADYFEKYAGRFISMHLQDWSPEQKKQVAVGKGIVDWKRTFAAAKTGGVKNYFVELDPPAMQESIPYLRALS